MQAFIINHEDGDGEAVKECRTDPWEINVPEGAFRWYGNVKETQLEIERRYPGVTGFGPTVGGT